MTGALTKGKTIESATCEPFRAAVRPFIPTAPAIMMDGVMLMHLVISLRSQGASDQFSAPSLTI